MAKLTVNIGSSENKGDGDPIRTAFDKINKNFSELYAGNFADPENIGVTFKPDADGSQDLGSADRQWGELHVKDFVYIGGVRLSVDAAGNLVIGGGVLAIQDVQGDIFADDSTKVFDSATGTFTAKFEGQFNGTFAADDSTILIDGVNGTIPGYVSVATLKSVAAASADFTDFQARIAAL